MTTKLTMLKSFPWYRDAYMQGKDYDVDDKVARQFVAAGLAKPANKAAAKAIATPPKVEPPKATPPAAAAQKPAEEQKAAGVVTAMMQPEKASQQKPAEKPDDEEAKKAAKVGKTEPYKRRDLTPEK